MNAPFKYLLDVVECSLSASRSRCEMFPHSLCIEGFFLSAVFRSGDSGKGLDPEGTDLMVESINEFIIEWHYCKVLGTKRQGLVGGQNITGCDRWSCLSA